MAGRFHAPWATLGTGSALWGNGANYSLGRLSQDSSMAWSDYLESPTEENRRKAETIDQLITQFRGNNGETLADDGTLTLISQDFANYLPQLVDQIKYEAAGALVALPTAVIPGVGAKGIKAAVVAASGIYAYKNMQGAAFKSLLEAGVDGETAKNAANNEALISSIIEMADTAISLALTGGGKAIDALSGGTVSTLKSQVTKLVGKNRATRFMTGLLKYLTNIISEGLEEATQESVSIANEENPHAGKLDLAKNAWGVFLDTVTNEDSENRDRVMEAFGGGARLAMLMGGGEMGGSAAVTNAVTNYQVGKIYGQDPQALIQEAQELNPNSTLAKKLQESLDNGKKISGGDLKRLVLENEKAIASMDSSSVESGAEQQPNDAGSPKRNGWRNAAELARQEDLSVMDALNRAGLSGSVDLARANPQSYAQSFQEALKGGASYDQALMRATSDAAMKVVGRQAPMDTLLYNIGGDPNKAVSVIGGALNRAGIRMTPGELNLLGIVAAEASAYQQDVSFQTKVALETLKGPKEEAWTAASEALWQEATDRVIEHGIADFAFSLDKGTNLRTGEIHSDLDQEAASQQSAWKQVTEDVSAVMESENEVEDADIESPKTIDNAEESDTMDSRGMAMSLRKPVLHILTEEEIQSVLTEARALEIDEKLLRINEGPHTSFSDEHECIFIRGNILPDPYGKTARDRMSIRAVLAHEYYGHYLHHPSEYLAGDWRDEFRASYEAAVKGPNLTAEERRDLMIDAYDRAKEAGAFQGYDDTARRIIYGY